MNIGGFGGMMASYPIKQYIGVEPHPENFEVAVKNLGEHKNFVLMNAAVVADDVETIELHLTKSKQNTCSGTTNLKSNGAKGLRPVVITVKAVNAFKLIEQYQPNILKVDIEGSEYSIFDPVDWQIPNCVKQIAIELHWADRVLAYEGLRKKFLDQGFTPRYEHLNYVPGTKEMKFVGETIKFRNLWGADCVFAR